MTANTGNYTVVMRQECPACQGYGSVLCNEPNIKTCTRCAGHKTIQVDMPLVEFAELLRLVETPTLTGHCGLAN